VRAQDPNETVAGYCDWVRGVAQSERALLHAPDALVRVQPDSDRGARIRTGLAYDAVRIYRGKLIASRASAECARFGAAHELALEVERGVGETERSGLAARLALLEAALPEARALAANVERAFAGERATIEELQTLRLRLDALSAERSRTQVLLGSLGPVASPLRAARIAELLREEVERERTVEAIEARLRRANALRLTLNGGYEHSSAHREIPAYGVVELAYNLGAARQFGADARAEDGRVRYARGRDGGPDSRLARVMLQLRAALAEEQRRLAEVSLLRRDAEQRWRSLEGIESDRVRRVRDHLWFDLTEARAEEAYLSARVRDLEVAVSDGAQTPIAQAPAPAAGAIAEN
jgi:hypothetical protein